MNQDCHRCSKYQIGGSLPANAPTYVIRQADRDLFDSLLAREYCYILNARQMGKSSLRVRTMNKLQDQGIACSEIELTGIGSHNITALQWYGGIVQELIDGFELSINRRSWWREREDLSPCQRLGEFIDTVLLKQIKQDIVIFIDEIDSVLSLDFPTDDFLALIHNFYNKRATNLEYRRLTFALMGVATPADLIQGESSTPFNIGKSIELHGFELSESLPLVQGFRDRLEQPEEILAQILSWTGGQPFLTQKLCRLIEQNSQVTDVQSLDRLVEDKILRNWESQDDPEHLRTIRDRLCRFANRSFGTTKNNSSQKLLKIYRKILLRGKIPLKDSVEHLELRLSGLVASNQGYLVVKNRIYKSVFDQTWLEQQLRELNRSDSNLIPFGRVILISLAIASSLIGIRSWGWLQPLELQSLDLLMRLRPKEMPDKRLLIVNITEEDVQSQPAVERGGASISDRSLAQLLAKLEKSSARVIGLDIFREAPLAAQYQSAIAPVQQSDRFHMICQFGNPGVPASVQVVPRHGFNNVEPDADRVLRRQIIAVSDSQPCNNGYALNWHLATRYLQDLGIKAKVVNNYLQLGNTAFKPLAITTGGYQKLDRSGHQILLNCRNSIRIAKTVSLQEALADSFDLNLVKDRIVLIGVKASSFNDDYWRTSCDDSQTGVEIQAHMTSQILSAVLDDRPLLWTLSQVGETIWIISWSLTGGILFYYGRSGYQVIAGISLIIVTISGSCWILLSTMGGWFPLLPPILVVILVSSTLYIYQEQISHRH